MSDHPESILIRLLQKLAHGVIHYPRLFFYPQVFLLILSIFYTVDKLQFSTSRNDLVGKEKKYHQNFLKFRQEFPGQDDLVVVVESEDLNKNRQFVERLGKRLEGETNLFTDVFYKGDLKMLGRKALLFVDEKTLGELKQTLKDYRPFIQNFTAATNLQSLFQLVNRQFLNARQESNADNDSMIKAMPALQRIIVEAHDSLTRPGNPPSPGLNALFGSGKEAEKEMYVTFDDGRIYLVSAHAKSDDLNGDAVERLRQLVALTQAEVPGVNIGVTGEPVLEMDEMKQSQIDTTVATIVSLVIVALIFIYGYQESGRPIKATICLIVGLAYTMGFTTLTVGHLNILTITFLPMLIGMAIDFGVHLISRYEEELRHGRTEHEALQKAMVYTGLGIFTGCFTTAGAFLAMGFTNFKGIQEMGIISGFGLLICLAPMMTLLPVLLLRGRQNRMDRLKHDANRRARFEQLWLQRPMAVMVWTALLCGVCLVYARRVFFDYNLLNMQSAGLPAVMTEKRLIDAATNSVLFGVVVADSLPQAAALEKKLTNLTTVASVRSMSTYLGGDVSEKLKIIGDVKREISSIQFAPMDLKSADVDALDQTLWSFQGYLGLATNEVHKGGDIALEGSLASLRKAVVDLRYDMKKAGANVTSAKLSAYQQALFGDIKDTFDSLRQQDDTGPMQATDLPPALRNRFIGVTGKYLLQVYPKGDVWRRDTQEAFVRQLREVDANATGTPVQLYEYTDLLKSSYQEAALYALGAIIILVFIHFRNISSVLLSLLPVGIGTIWMIGIMGMTGVAFNPANIMTLPLVIGVGVTSGIHILNRFAEEPQPTILAKSTGMAVIISALTTVAGFGSLLLAKHQGIRSLGFVMSVGTATCMVAALTFLPALLTLLTKRGWKLK
jgi:hypothetical protein